MQSAGSQEDSARKPLTLRHDQPSAARRSDERGDVRAFRVERCGSADGPSLPRVRRMIDQASAMPIGIGASV
jgi:hypothetical protein